jgi:Glycosyl transferase family 2
MSTTYQRELGLSLRQPEQPRRAGQDKQNNLRDMLVMLQRNAIALRDWARRPAAAPVMPPVPVPRNGTLLAPRPATGRPARPDPLPGYRPVSDGMAIAPTISVVIPAKNEAANLPDVFATLPGWIDEVVLVDGRSQDDTISVARRLRPDIKIVHQGGVGKGDALIAGFGAASGDIIVAIDGDGSTDGREMVRFVSTLLAGADFVKGSRFASDGRSDDITVVRRYGNRILNIMVNKLFRTQYTDLCYGYNAFWARHLGKLALDAPGFEVETLMGIRAAKARLRIHEVPSHERPRQHGSSNLSAIRDGLRILRVIGLERAKAVGQRGPKPFVAPARVARDTRPPA